MQDLARLAFTCQGMPFGGAERIAGKLMAICQMKHQAPIRWIIVFVVLLVSTFFWLVASRFVSLPPLIVAWVLSLTFGHSRIRPIVIAWTVWLALTFSPIDVIPMPKGGAPRLVPLVMGLPTVETAERAKRGEVILGGCIVTGFEPKYYLVW